MGCLQKGFDKLFQKGGLACCLRFEVCFTGLMSGVYVIDYS